MFHFSSKLFSGLLIFAFVLTGCGVCPPTGFPQPPGCGDNPKIDINLITARDLIPVVIPCGTNDRNWSVVCKPAYEVIKKEFDQTIEKTMYPVPYINGGTSRIAWPCNVHAMSEDKYISALEEKFVDMKKMGVNTISMRIELVQDLDYTKSTFYQNTFGFNGKNI
jgi:hypothetical protein